MLEVVRVPIPILVPIVLVMCTVGTYAMRNSLFDVALALAFGVLGAWLRVRGYPVVPLVIALILGPMAESYLLRALQLGTGDPLYLVSSPIAAVLFALIVALLGYQVFSAIRGRAKPVLLPRSEETPAAEGGARRGGARSR